jgi:hypothetical protein
VTDSATEEGRRPRKRRAEVDPPPLARVRAAGPVRVADLGRDAGVIDAHMREQEGFDKCDRAHFDALLHGCIAEAADLDAVLARHVDRKTTELSPIEHGVLMIGAYELQALHRRAVQGRDQRGRRARQELSAAPTATSTSTASSTRRRRTAAVE